MTKGRKTGGRIKGVPNRVTTDIAAMAREYGPMCIEGLAELAVFGTLEATRSAAMRELLDRGFGKAAQALQVTSTGNITIRLVSYAGRTDSPVLTLPRPGNGHSVAGGTNGSGSTPPE